MGGMGSSADLGNAFGFEMRGRSAGRGGMPLVLGGVLEKI